MAFSRVKESKPARDYLDRHGMPRTADEPRRDDDLIWYFDSLVDVAPRRGLDELLPRATARLQTKNITGHHSPLAPGWESRFC